eukprot:7151471-Prymnesium_polylepis.1
MPLNKASIAEGLVSPQEFATLISLLTETLPLESRGRVRNATLVPLNLVPVLCQKLGRSQRTRDLLAALQQPLPRLWAAQEEAEANAHDGELDLVLEEEIEELEEEEAHFATELVQMAPFASDEADEEKAKSWRLERVPNALVRELQEFVDYRSSPLNRQRDGSCVVDSTVGADKRTCLAFLGYLVAEHEIQPGLGVFGKAELSTWCESWLHALETKQLKYSTMANCTPAHLSILHKFSDFADKLRVQHICRRRGCALGPRHPSGRAAAAQVPHL